MAVTRLQEKYLSEAVKGLMDKFNYKNVNELPKVEKIVINIGCGDAVTNSKAIDSAVADLTVITGQKPVVTKAKKSIAAFKLRAGMPIGTKVTLRGERMYHFLDKLMNIALPRVRDFRGVNPKSFDGRGNYSMLADGEDFWFAYSRTLQTYLTQNPNSMLLSKIYWRSRQLGLDLLLIFLVDRHA